MKKITKIQLAVLILIGAGILFFVAWKNIFPSFYYKFLVRVNSYQLAGETFVEVTPRYDYPFNKVSAYIKTNNKTKANCTLPVYKGFIVNAYPIAGTINEQASLKKYLYSDEAVVPNGTLLFDKQAVYVVSNGTYRAFTSPDIFERLGYKWEMVIPFEAGFKEGLVQGELVTLNAVHPDGTLLKTARGEYYIVWQQQRFFISDPELINQVWKNFHWVDIAEKEVIAIGNCQGEQNNQGEINCSFNPSASNKIQEGKAYLFKLNGDCQGLVKNAEIILRSKPFDKEVLRQSLSDIKNQIYARYFSKN